MVEKLMHAKLVGGERYGNFYIYIRSLIQGTEKQKKKNETNPDEIEKQKIWETVLGLWKDSETLKN